MKIQILIGSVREGRLSKPVAEWVHRELSSRSDIEPEVVDLKDWDLPMFALPKSPGAGNYEDPLQIKWGQWVDRADGYIFVSPEYNHGYSAVLKNALDYVYAEWNKKPCAFVSFGSVSGARSVEQLRLVAVELKMAPLRDAVHIKDIWSKMEGGALKADTADLKQLARAADELVWWATALKTAREAAASK
jgi:NAD(P)H-dependent FMN reductase